MSADSGYLYAMTNESMPGLLKIGMTERDPTDRLRDANASDTWRPPTPYKIAFAKAVTDPRTKEARLHTLLARFGERPHPNREFFRISVDDARAAFELLDGTWWSPAGSTETLRGYIPIDVDTLGEATAPARQRAPINLNVLGQGVPVAAAPRTAAQIFTDGQRIRHRINGERTSWMGRYDATEDGFIQEGITYTSLSGFALAHHRAEGHGRSTANGWAECEAEVNGEWVTAINLR